MIDKKILIISYLFPPIYDAQSIRWFELATQLLYLGFKVDIIAIDPKVNYSPNKLNNLKIHRIKSGPMETILLSLKKNLNVESSNNASIRNKVLFKLGKSTLETFKKIYGSLLLGDYKTEWFPFCATFLKGLDLNKYDAVITSQFPLVDGLIGLYIKKINHNIFWIADIGDPVCAPYYSKLKKLIDEYFEKKIVQKANRIIVTNKNVRLLLSCKYGVTRKKIEIITQGFDEERFKNKKPKKTKNKIFTMLYSGTFYRGFREPKNLIEALYQLKHLNFKLQITGRNELFLKDFDKVKEKIEFLGFVPYEESLKLQDEADALVNISNKQTHQVPGKIYEYIGSKKPILNIVYDENKDETAWLINRYRIGVVCKNKTEEIKEAILKLYKAWENNRLHKMFDFSNSELLKFSWQAGAKKLGKIIEEGLSER